MSVWSQGQGLKDLSGHILLVICTLMTFWDLFPEPKTHTLTAHAASTL